ncbi:MAG: signal peptidase II [Clostridium sp.]
MEFLGLMAGLFGLDIFLKGKIEAQDTETFPRDMQGTGGKIRIYKNHNDGFCFGFLKKNKELVTLIPIVFTSAAAGILTWLLTKKGETVHKLGFSLVVAGAASNLYDRLVRGYVVDYFSPQLGFLKKIVFNIGDICIFLGALILAVRDLMKD